MNLKLAIVFIGLLSCQMTWADCIYLRNQNCIQIRPVEVTQKGKDQFCVGRVEKKTATKGKPESLNVFFQTCPKPGTTLKGDLTQRPDITLEGLAPCQYEFKPNPTCE